MARAAKIKLLLMDVDGVLTDGKLYFIPGADGKMTAIEVLVFPEAMRGVAEGHFPWDNRPGSMMTNAAVETTVAGNDGQTLTVKYKDGEKKVMITPQTTIVKMVPGAEIGRAHV